MNIGILGGTFDPVHVGHIRIAEEARSRLALAQVVFLPAGQPQLKGERVITPAVHRLEMVKLAIAGRPYCELSTAEVERPGPSYTLDTIILFRQQVGVKGRLFFLLGWDSLAGFARWKEPARLIELCEIVAVPRPGFPRPDLRALESSVPGITGKVVFLDMPLVDVSSSEIRGRVSRGLSIQGLVPEAVEKYIRDSGLYVEEQKRD